MLGQSNKRPTPYSKIERRVHRHFKKILVAIRAYPKAESAKVESPKAESPKAEFYFRSEK